MSWVKLDDGFAEHPKILRAGAHGLALWVCGLAYCNRQKRRDGVIPEEKVALLYPVPHPMKVAAHLVAVGLWERVTAGYMVHDYHDFQPDAERAAEISAKRAEAGRLGGQRSGEARAKQIASPVLQSVKQTHEANANPVPVPVPVPEEEQPPLTPRKRGEGAVRDEYKYGPEFLRFWKAYPTRHGVRPGKGTAWRAWKRHRCAPLLEAILAAVDRAKASPEWRKDGGQFVPHPATWLNRRGWEDDHEAGEEDPFVAVMRGGATS